MAFYQFHETQQLPVSKEEVWDFISSPANLKEITPDHMGFDIITKNLPKKMYPGMIIGYKVSPLLGIKMKWVTEITHIQNLHFFVDEQRIGPYKMWHHQHIIQSIEGGTEMKDIVTYQPPFGLFGTIANTLIIKKQLRKIFDYRKSAVEKKFGKF